MGICPIIYKASLTTTASNTKTGNIRDKTLIKPSGFFILSYIFNAITLKIPYTEISTRKKPQISKPFSTLLPEDFKNGLESKHSTKAVAQKIVYKKHDKKRVSQLYFS